MPTSALWALIGHDNLARPGSPLRKAVDRGDLDGFRKYLVEYGVDRASTGNIDCGNFLTAMVRHGLRSVDWRELLDAVLHGPPKVSTREVGKRRP